MTAITVLFACGLLLLACEVFVPGLVLGILGGGLMAAGTVVAYAKYGSAVGGLTGIAGVILVGATFATEFWLMPKKGTMKWLRIGVGKSGTEPQAPADAAQVVGRIGVAVTALAPSGYVKLDQRRYGARSEGGFVAAGDPITVVGVTPFQLLVNPASSQSL